MEIRQHEWLAAAPHEGFEQLRLKSRPKEPAPSLARGGANFYSGVKQQDYSASVWLRRKDKLEHVRRPAPPGPHLPRARTHRGGGHPPIHPSTHLSRACASPLQPGLPRLHFLAARTGLCGGEGSLLSRVRLAPRTPVPRRRPRGGAHFWGGAGVTKSEGAAASVARGARRCVAVALEGRLCGFGGSGGSLTAPAK